MKETHHFVVVDDDATSNMICEFNIRKFNPKAKIELFSKPEEAFSVIKAGNIDQPTILFLDINMPKMTGWEFLDAFKGLNSDIRNRFTIYMLSSSIETFDEEAILYPFINGFISKPLTVELMERNLAMTL